MTKKQESHLADIQNRLVQDLDTKYRKGQAEHGGNLWDRNVSHDILAEAIDLITYAYTNDFKRRQAISSIQSFLSTKNEDHLQQAIEWLTNKQITQ